MSTTNDEACAQLQDALQDHAVEQRVFAEGFAAKRRGKNGLQNPYSGNMHSHHLANAWQAGHAAAAKSQEESCPTKLTTI